MTKSSKQRGNGIRVYELAQRLGIDYKDLIKRLANTGVIVTNHMSLIGTADAKAFSEAFKTSEVAPKEKLVSKPTVIRRRAKVVELPAEVGPPQLPPSELVEQRGPNLDERRPDATAKKSRVHDLAKRMGIGSKELMLRLAANGVAVKSHMTNVSDVDFKLLSSQESNIPTNISQNDIGLTQTSIRGRADMVVPADDASKLNSVESVKRLMPNQIFRASDQSGSAELSPFAERLAPSVSNIDLSTQRKQLLMLLKGIIDLVGSKHSIISILENKRLNHGRALLINVLHQVVTVADSVYTVEDLIDESYFVTGNSRVLSRTINNEIKSGLNYDLIDEVKSLKSRIALIEKYFDDRGFFDIYSAESNNEAARLPAQNNSIPDFEYYPTDFEIEDLSDEFLGEFDGVSFRMEPTELHSNRVIERLSDIEARLDTNNVDDSGTFTDSIEDRIDKLQTIFDNSKLPYHFEQVEKRLQNGIENGAKLQNSKLTLRSDYSIIADQMKEHGFFLDQDTIKDICDKLHTNMILILEGPTGTGKTTLASLLPKILLGANATSTTRSIDADVNIESVLGHLRASNNHYGVALGFLTEAVLESIETSGNNWLVLDEINRGDISTAFSPLLKALADNKPLLEWEMFPNRENHRGEIPIPLKFRIIGTMNSHDKNQLHQLSDALMRRVGIVNLRAPEKEKEFKLLYDRIVSSYVNEQFGSISKKIADKFETAVKTVLDIADIFRKVSHNKPVYLYYKAYIGSALLFNVCEIVLKDIINAPNSDVLTIADSAFSAIIVAHRSDWHVELCKQLMQETNNKFINIYSTLNKLLHNQVI